MVFDELLTFQNIKGVREFFLHQNGRKIKLMAHPIIDKVSADIETAGVRVVKISLFLYLAPPCLFSQLLHVFH